MISKALILRFSSLGDIVMTTAMIRCLRKAYPDAEIDMVVREDFLDLIRDNPHLNRKITLSRKEGTEGLKRLFREISGQYDLVYDAHRSLRTRLLMPFVKAKHKAYFQKQYVRRSIALTFKLPLLDGRRFLERFTDPLAPYGVHYDHQGPEIFIPPTVGTEVASRFGIRPELRYVGLVPSAQWPGKRWSTEKFRELAQRLVTQPSLHLLVFGGTEDHFCGGIVAGLPSGSYTNLQGKVSIREAGALLQRCSAVVANDTGLMHVADAVNVPVVGILGPTSGDLGCLPYQPASKVVEEMLWCRPCSKNGQAPCIRSRRYCLENITVDRVLQSSLAILSESRS